VDAGMKLGFWAAGLLGYWVHLLGCCWAAGLLLGCWGARGRDVDLRLGPSEGSNLGPKLPPVWLHVLGPKVFFLILRD